MTYSADSIKADIDKAAEIARLVEKYKIKQFDWDVEGINLKLQSLTDSDERQSFYMVANWLIHGGKNVFLQDGNSMILRDGRLSEVLIYLKKVFPEINRITSYGRAENLSRISKEEYAELKEAGLTRIHSGFETGSDEVLKYINKGLTKEQEITAGKNIKAGGIELSVYFMPGVGGLPLSKLNAEETADVINQVNPDYLRIRTFTAKSGTELYEDYNRGAELARKYKHEVDKSQYIKEMDLCGENDQKANLCKEQKCNVDFYKGFQDNTSLSENLKDYIAGNIMIPCSDKEKLLEIRRVIELAEGIDTVIVSDHIVNLLQTVEGRMVDDKEMLLRKIDEFLNLPDEAKKEFQLARRLGLVMELEDVKKLDPGTLIEIKNSIKRIPENEWEIRMNLLMERYV